MQFTKDTCELIQKIITEVLEGSEELKTLGVRVTQDGGVFDVASFKMKLKISNLDQGDAQEAERFQFAKYARMFGLEPYHYGRQFLINRQSYCLVALEPNRPKFPFVGSRADGKRFRFTDSILPALQAKGA